MHYITGFLIQLAIVAFLVVVGFFVAGNGHEAALHIPFTSLSVDLPVWLPILGAFMIGFLLAFSVERLGKLGMRWSLRRAQAKLAAEEEKNAATEAAAKN